MTDDRAKEDLALIREAIEEGRAYATGCSPDMLVWGVAVAIGHLGTYAYVRRWSGLDPGWLWTLCIGLPWLYSLRGLGRRAFDRAAPVRRTPTVAGLRMMWLGSGIFLTILGIAAGMTGDIRFGWFNAVVAGVMGSALFASAALVNLAWLRWVAVAWWAGEIAVYALRHQPAAMLLSAVLMLALLAGPGLVLVLRRRAVSLPG